MTSTSEPDIPIKLRTMANYRDDISAIRIRSNPTEDSRIDLDFVSIADKLRPATISFSDKEQEILAIYDSLQEMRLENAMIEAQVSHGDQIGSGADLKALEDAERQHLEARAAYSLSDHIIKNVLQVDPLLKAIHSGENASPMERQVTTLKITRDC